MTNQQTAPLAATGQLFSPLEGGVYPNPVRVSLQYNNSDRPPGNRQAMADTYGIQGDVTPSPAIFTGTSASFDMNLTPGPYFTNVRARVFSFPTTDWVTCGQANFYVRTPPE